MMKQYPRSKINSSCEHAKSSETQHRTRGGPEFVAQQRQRAKERRAHSVISANAGANTRGLRCAPTAEKKAAAEGQLSRVAL